MASKKTRATNSSKQAEKARNTRRREREAFRREQSRQIDKQLRQALSRLQRVGAYSPTGSKLTAWRKRRIKETTKEISAFLNPDEFFFKGTRSKPKKARRQIKEGAEAQGYRATTKGIFVPRKTTEGGVTKTFTSAKLERSTLKGRTVYRIVEERTTASGKTERHIVPLVKADFVIRELVELNTELDDIKRKMKKNERIRFLIGRTGLGHESYSPDAFDKLMAKLQFYKSTVGALAQMLAHTRFVITHEGETRQGMIQRLVREGEMDQISRRRRTSR